MHVNLYSNDSSSLKRGRNATAKSIDPGQPAQSAQAELDQNFLLAGNFMPIKGPNYVPPFRC